MSPDALAAFTHHAGGSGESLDALIALTLLSLAPFLVVMTTSFVRIVVVLSLVRSAIGAAALPPNAVITGLALVLTYVVMSPAIQTISHTALEPYGRGQISRETMTERAYMPLHGFMLRQTRRADLTLFARAAQVPDGNPNAAPPTVLIPAFVVGELRNAFAIGFALYLPFTAIDLVVAAVLMGLGMYMLSPPIVSLPCKLLLFVMVDGWALVCGELVRSFR